MSGEKPLFIPLRRTYFEDFRTGAKMHEYRPLGARWNATTCRVGRKVTLSLGYGKHQRLHGFVSSFAVQQNPQALPGWKECYSNRNAAAVIGITIIEYKRQ